MAVGGIAMVGCSGEDYATPGHDSIALQTTDPWEIVHNVAALQDSVVKAMSIRRNAKQTAARYTWDSVIRRCLLPALSMIGVPHVEVEEQRRLVDQACRQIQPAAQHHPPGRIQPGDAAAVRPEINPQHRDRHRSAPSPHQ
jgi:hypothetical protein